MRTLKKVHQNNTCRVVQDLIPTCKNLFGISRAALSSPSKIDSRNFDFFHGFQFTRCIEACQEIKAIFLRLQNDDDEYTTPCY